MFDELHDISEKVRRAVETPPVQNFYLDLKRSGIDNKKARYISKLISENMKGGLLQILPDSVIHMDFSENPITSAGFVHICSTWNNALKNTGIESGSIDFKIDFSNTKVGDVGYKYMAMFNDDMVTHDFKFSKFVISGLFEEQAKESTPLHDTLRDVSGSELLYDSDEKVEVSSSDESE
ncbi:MAG: hypothetical protein HRU36_04580 [Rickettsiales bacterium]|nr:hypothetical protein [Rickettsiales bacterium]